MRGVAWIAFGFGALLCLANFYFSFLRYPLHRLRGLPREAYRWESGIPLLGSLLVGLSLFGLHALPSTVIAALVLIIIDTGGIHWFAGVMVYQAFCGKKRS
jgi:hypothetical protein